MPVDLRSGCKSEEKGGAVPRPMVGFVAGRVLASKRQVPWLRHQPINLVFVIPVLLERKHSCRHVPLRVIYATLLNVLRWLGHIRRGLGFRAGWPATSAVTVL